MLCSLKKHCLNQFYLFFFLILHSFRLDVLSREGLFQPFCPPIMGLDNQLKTIINT